MVEFKPADAVQTEEAYKAAGVPFERGVLAYRAEEGGVYAGCCVIRRKGKEAELILKTNGVDYIYDGLLRASLNLIWKLGVKTAFLDGEINESLIGRLGFSKEGGKLQAEVKEDMFFTCCGDEHCEK